MAEEIAAVEAAGVDGIHLDVMDGHFVPNISFGPPVIHALRKTTALPFWAHLMISEPSRYLEAYRDAGVQGIVIHCEIEEDWVGLADRIRAMGLEGGVAVNPETDLSRIENVLDRFNRVLVMTVHPGFGGQSFLPEPLKKIQVLREKADTMTSPLRVAVDGGINAETGRRVAEAGADILVVGSAIYGAQDYADAVKTIRTEAMQKAQL